MAIKVLWMNEINIKILPVICVGCKRMPILRSTIETRSIVKIWYKET